MEESESNPALNNLRNSRLIKPTHCNRYRSRFGMTPVKIKCKTGRGSADAVAIVDATLDTWDEVEEARENLTEE